MAKAKIAKKGHNRVGGVDNEQLKSIVERIERLEDEKKGISADITDIFTEAKGSGFDVKAIRRIIKMRKLSAEEREAQELVYDTYCRALGMTPEEMDESLD
jgi:uncharacterized protein (UPF0335 family)